MGYISNGVANILEPAKKIYKKNNMDQMPGEKMNLWDLVSAFVEKDIATRFLASGFFHDPNVIFRDLGEDDSWKNLKQKFRDTVPLNDFV